MELISTIQEFAQLNVGQSAYNLSYNFEGIKPIVNYEAQREYTKEKIKKDFQILADINQALLNNPNMKEGDYVRRKDGSMSRITVGRMDSSIQVGGTENHNYHASIKGYTDYSGGCGDSIKRESLRLTSELKAGRIWFAHDNYLTGGCAVYGVAMFRVYEEI